MSKSTYEKSDLNAKLYSSFRKDLAEFYRSEAYFFLNEVKFYSGFSVLDVGGGWDTL